MMPDNFTIELEKTTNGRFWAFVVIDHDSAIAAGMADTVERAIADALAAAERNCWRNPFHAPPIAYERSGTE
jgi:hypothetical protein